jgi:hypothetical protein
MGEGLQFYHTRCETNPPCEDVTQPRAKSRASATGAPLDTGLLQSIEDAPGSYVRARAVN